MRAVKDGAAPCLMDDIQQRHPRAMLGRNWRSSTAPRRCSTALSGIAWWSVSRVRVRKLPVRLYLTDMLRRAHPERYARRRPAAEHPCRKVLDGAQRYSTA